MEEEILDLMEKWVLETRMKNISNNLQKVGIIAYLERKKYEKGK